jgi:iron complex outermembrane receptor protein
MAQFIRVFARSFNSLRAAQSAGKLALTGAVILSTGIASAQENSSSGDNVLEEVVVTAQFRETKLQDTPIAITAVTGDMLEARSQTSISDVANQAPSVNIKPAAAAFGPGVAAFIRGVGQYDTSFALEPGVGMYIDDVYYSTVAGSDFDLMDLDRIEILRGPQGTLAGKNAIGGAVKLYSRRPSADPDAYIAATIGSYNRHDIRGATNITLLPDRLFARITGVANSRDGYVDRIDYACSHPGSNVPSAKIDANSGCKLGTYGGQDVRALRAQLRWIVSDALEVNFAGDITDDQSDLAPVILRALPAAGYTFPNGVRVDSSFIPQDPYISYATYTASQQGNSANGANFSSFSVPDGTDYQAKGGSAEVDWRPSDTLYLKSITAYRTYDTAFGADADETPYDYQTLYSHFTHRQFSQEMRLGGALFGNAVDWTIGGYYFDSRSVIGGRIHIPGTFDFTPNDPVDVENISGFAHGTWHVTDALNLTLGYRYTDDSKTYTFSRRDSTNPAVVPASLTAIDGLKSRYKGSRSDYKVALDYHWAPNFMTYLQWSTGFRGGGVAPRPFYGNQGVSFNPETLDAYEIGFKSDLFDRRVRLNMAAFHNKYQGILLSPTAAYFNPNMPIDNNGPGNPLYNPATYNPTTGTFPAAVPLNAGDGEFTGVELETEIHPVDGLTIDASASWMQFEFTRLSSSVQPIPVGSCVGGCIKLSDPWFYTPKWKASLGAQWEFPFSRGASLTPRVDVAYQGSFTTRVPVTTYSVVDAYTVVNARLTWRSASRDWESALEVTNLADRVYFLNAFDLRNIGGVATGTIAPPRQFALSLKRRF